MSPVKNCVEEPWNTFRHNNTLLFIEVISFPMEERMKKLGDFIPTVIISSSEPDQSPRSRSRLPFIKKIEWASLLRSFRDWAKEPINMGLLSWLLIVSIGLFIYFLLITDMLNNVIPQKSRREIWIEVDDQILNALFTILCIYQHPRLVHHFFILLRWTPEDARELRCIYSKKITAPKNERFHLGIIISLLHTTCYAQYVICGLYWGFNTSNRPEIILYFFVGVGTLCPVFAGLYVLFGPLGRRRSDGEVAAPPPPALWPTGREWAGGVFDCWDDKPVFFQSFFCTVCVFGRNMETLGLGNKFVHVATFTLVIVSPFLVFNVAAMKIENEVWKEMMMISGVVLSFLGLVYAGFWRTQMRRKLKLPGNTFCCGLPNFTDCFQWIFCWSCSLAQEVRTGIVYSGEVGSPSPAPEKKAEESGCVAGKNLRSLSISGFPGMWERPLVELPQRSVSSPGRIYSFLPVLGHPARVADSKHDEERSETLPPRAPSMNF